MTQKYPEIRFYNPDTRRIETARLPAQIVDEFLEQQGTNLEEVFELVRQGNPPPYVRIDGCNVFIGEIHVGIYVEGAALSRQQLWDMASGELP